MKTNQFFLVFVSMMNVLFSLSAQDSLSTRSDTALNKKTILILSSFDAMSMKARKNKKELFAQLADSLKQILYTNIHSYNKTEAVVIPELLAETGNADSSLNSLMINHDASSAIVIKTLDVHFDQTGVEVTGVKHDKTRIASYDICAVVSYKLYKRETNAVESETIFCEHYTQRHVISGLLATGPDIVGKRKDAFKIIEKNAQKYLKVFFMK